jgi:hypothetical protein
VPRSQIDTQKNELQQLVYDISSLRTYKLLHDNLHHLQIIFPLFAEAARNIQEASEDLDKYINLIENHSISIRRIIQELPSSRQSIEVVWAKKLEATAELAQQAIDGLDGVVDPQECLMKRGTKARKSIREFRGLLVRETSRIDGILNAGLNLGDLKDLFTRVAKRQSIDSMAAATLRQGSISTEHILSQIKALVNQHFQWQEIDLALWEVEEQLRNPLISDASDFDTLIDASDFDALWKEIKGNVAMMIETEPTVAGTKLLNKLDAVNSERVDKDWQGLKLKFERFSRAARLEFLKVDSRLNTLAGEVVEIGMSLQNLLHSYVCT